VSSPQSLTHTHTHKHTHLSYSIVDVRAGDLFTVDRMPDLQICNQEHKRDDNMNKRVTFFVAQLVEYATSKTEV